MSITTLIEKVRQSILASSASVVYQWTKGDFYDVLFQSSDERDKDLRRNIESDIFHAKYIKGKL